MPRLDQNPQAPLERLRQSNRDRVSRLRSLLAPPRVQPEVAWPFVTGGSSLQIYNLWPTTTTTASTGANFYPTSVTTATNVWWSNVPVVPYQLTQPSQPLDIRWWDYEARRRRDAILREKARKRGRRLLMGILNDQQLIEYAKTRGFTVVGDKGGIFRIQKVGRVQELDPHRHIIALHCIHLSFAYIEEDNLVALKMLIETDEMEFRHIANTQHTHPLPLQEAA